MALSDLNPVERNEEGIAAVLGILKQRLGERFQTGQAIRSAARAHHHLISRRRRPTPSSSPTRRPRCRRSCAPAPTHRVPVIPFGVGSSLEGHVNAPGGGVSVDMSRMNRILAVHAEDLDCVVEPGVTRKQLNAHLRDTGLFFPIDPGADATLGGMAATRASGTNAVRYGTMRDNVLILTAVMADGAIVKTGNRAKKSLRRLRSDAAAGRLGGHARHHHRADAEAAWHSARRSPAASVRSRPSRPPATRSSRPSRCGIPVARIELLDALQVRACNAYSKLDLAGEPTPVRRVPRQPTPVSPSRPRPFGMIAAEFGGGDLPVDQRRRGAAKAVAGAARCLLGVADAAAGRQGVCRPMSACRSRGLPNASPRPKPTSPRAA